MTEGCTVKPKSCIPFPTHRISCKKMRECLSRIDFETQKSKKEDEKKRDE